MASSHLRPNGRFIGDSREDAIDASRRLVICGECGERWREDLLDECVACGLGADVGICPKCMQTRFCEGVG